MKKAIIVLWSLLAITVLSFVISIFTASTQTTWTIFSIMVICGWIAFGGTIILLVIHYNRFKKKD